ncbi:MAG: DUF4173 domain-containing protein [Clostridiales bacterium]|nr:DUF4173 domain-containing protein [Clostridiales bacterium]
MNTNTKQAEILKFLCLGLSYVFSFAYVHMIMANLKPVQLTIYITCLSIVAVIWLELTMAQQRLLGRFIPSKIQVFEARFWEAILVLLCINTHFGQLRELTLFFIHMVVIYMALCGTGHLLSDRSSCLMPFDLINGMFRIPFRNYFARILSVTDSVSYHRENVSITVSLSDGGSASGEAVSSRIGDPSGEQRPRSVFGVIVVLCIIGLIFIMAVENLARVDSRFEHFFMSIDSFFSSVSVSLTLIKFIVSIPIGAYLFGLFQGGVRLPVAKEKEFHGKLVESSARFRFMPDVLFSVVILIFLLVYLIFFISQAEYMFSAFAGVLPEAFTASEYAVSGFHELINVVLINFVLLSLVRIFGSQENRLIRILSIILMAASMLFSTISASKIILYMSRFGYTSSRTLGLWGTAVVFAGSLLAIVHLVFRKRTFTPWLLLSAGSYVAMNFLCYPWIG